MPKAELTFTELCDHLDLSRSTVRKRLGELRIKPVRRIGHAKLYTAEQAQQVRERHASHGGRWPQKSIR